MKIVIADDSEILRERIKNSLSDIKEVEIVGEAANGKEALKIIHDKIPDFVLLDIRMPELNGIEVLTRLKDSKSKPIICIFTNYPYSQYKQKCSEEGADYFFDKNVNFQEIKNMIKKIAQKQGGVSDG
jgi:YesN/AraC family two-component response regulator